MKKLCIVTPAIGKYSETFISNQIKHLPFEKTIITTGNGEFADENEKPLANLSLYAKLIRFIDRKSLGGNFESQQNKLLTKFLKKIVWKV